MASAQGSNHVVICLKSGDSITGKLTSIDKVNFKITLNQATKILKDAPDKKEYFETLEVGKDSIGEIKLVKCDQPKQMSPAEVQNINAIPENKIPVQAEQHKAKLYDKDSFFDNLTIASKVNVKKETQNYNDKNKDTFDYPYDPENKFQHQHKRGGYNNYKRGNFQGNGGHFGRGRGRGGFQGGYNNNYQRGNFHQGNYRGGNRGFGRGRGRGGRGGHYNRGGDFNNMNRPNQPNSDASKLKPYQPEGGIQPEMEKSIYDN